jgi:hypothetical protein
MQKTCRWIPFPANDVLTMDRSVACLQAERCSNNKAIRTEPSTGVQAVRSLGSFLDVIICHDLVMTSPEQENSDKMPVRLCSVAAKKKHRLG